MKMVLTKLPVRLSVAVPGKGIGHSQCKMSVGLYQRSTSLQIELYLEFRGQNKIYEIKIDLKAQVSQAAGETTQTKTLSLLIKHCTSDLMVIASGAIEHVTLPDVPENVTPPDVPALEQVDKIRVGAP